MNIKEIIVIIKDRDKYLIEKLGFLKMLILSGICVFLVLTILSLICYKVEQTISIIIIKGFLAAVCSSILYYKFGYYLVKQEEKLEEERNMELKENSNIK